jgi:hypothetical protein
MAQTVVIVGHNLVTQSTSTYPGSIHGLQYTHGSSGTLKHKRGLVRTQFRHSMGMLGGKISVTLHNIC